MGTEKEGGFLADELSLAVPVNPPGSRPLVDGRLPSLSTPSSVVMWSVCSSGGTPSLTGACCPVGQSFSLRQLPEKIKGFGSILVGISCVNVGNSAQVRFGMWLFGKGVCLHCLHGCVCLCGVMTIRRVRGIGARRRKRTLGVHEVLIACEILEKVCTFGGVAEQHHRHTVYGVEEIDLVRQELLQTGISTLVEYVVHKHDL
jgi:hypothetical protein